jgi:hypothetical protein
MEPNEEDIQNATMHRCLLFNGHQGAHTCICGAAHQHDDLP